jgi:hypothetical protein
MRGFATVCSIDGGVGIHLEHHQCTIVDDAWFDQWCSVYGDEFFERCRSVLEAYGRSYLVISGDWETRFGSAVAAIDRLLGPLAGAPPIAAQVRITEEFAVNDPDDTRKP